MPSIYKISDLLWDSIDKLDDISKSLISKYSDIDKPSAPPPSCNGYVAFRLNGYNSSGQYATQYMMMTNWEIFTGTNQSGTSLPNPKLTGYTGSGWSVTGGTQYAGYEFWRPFRSGTSASTGWWSLGIANGALNYITISSTTGCVDVKSMRISIDSNWTQASYFEVWASTGGTFTGEQEVVYTFTRTGTTGVETHNFNLPTSSTGTTSFISLNQIARWDPAIYSGTSWTDIVNTGLTNGQIHNMNVTNGIFTNVGSPSLPALYFDGVGDYAGFNRYGVYGTDDLFYHPTKLTAYTYDFWVRSDGNWTGQGNIISQYNAATRTRFGGGSPSNHNITYLEGMTAGQTSSGVFTINTWQHIAYTMSGNGTSSVFSVYRNGVYLHGSSTGKYAPQTWVQGTLLIGTYNGTSEFSKHYVGDMRVYNRPLSLVEINQNYHSNAKKYGHTT